MLSELGAHEVDADFTRWCLEPRLESNDRRHTGYWYDLPYGFNPMAYPLNQYRKRYHTKLLRNECLGVSSFTVGLSQCQH